MDKKTEKKLLAIVKNNYEEIASDFSETRKKQLWPELIKLTELVENNSKILDVGCGNGRLLEAFTDKNIDYLGVDGSANLIKLARKRFNSGKFMVNDILELSKLPELNFDYIFCIAVLHHLPGKKLQIQALKQIKNKIKPNGKIIITVWNLWGQKKYRKLIIQAELLKIFNKIKLWCRCLNFKKNKSYNAKISPLNASMDFGDILFDWKNPQGEKISQRYYHAFTKRELKKIIKKSELKIEKIYKDKFNYYAVLKKM